MTDPAPEARGAAAGQDVLAWLPAVLLAGFGPLVYVAPLGAVPGLLVLTLGLGLVAWRAGAWRGGAVLRDFALFLPLFAWMLLSGFWSLDAQAGLSLALRLAGLFLAGTASLFWLRSLPPGLIGRCLPGLAIGFAASAAVVVLDLGLLQGETAQHLHAPQAPNYDLALFYGRGATIQSILMVPLTLGLWCCGARRLALLQAVLGGLAILLTASLSAKMALGAGLAVGAAVFVLPAFRYALLGLLALLVAALPFALPYQPDAAQTCWFAETKGSALHRLYIWNFAAEHIALRPVLGWGLDASRRMPGGDERVVVWRCDADGQPMGAHPRVDGTLMPLHPHNAILQLWLELGGIGALIGCATLGLILLRAFAAPAWRHRAAQAGFAAAWFGGMSVALVSFGIWQEWFLSALFVAAGVAALAARQERPA
jgi:O-antigen ligase